MSEEKNTLASKYNYESLKILAKQMKTPVDNLIAETRTNDPFYSGTPADVIKAEWFRDIWEKLGCGTGTHIRRIHYKMIGIAGGVPMPDGRIYGNEEADWNYLELAAKHARYQGLVSAKDFVDMRTPTPFIFAEYKPIYMPYLHIEREDNDLPFLPDSINIELPYPLTMGYQYSLTDQPYHLEIWIEKSTQNEFLIPLCKKYGVNLIVGMGQSSITGSCDLLKRIKAANKPARIFYISDYDTAGKSMPVSASRKIEFFGCEDNLDIQVFPLVLTMEQINQYKINHVPSDEHKYELDAMDEKLLIEIVESKILEYRDLKIQEEIEDMGTEEQRRADELFEDELGQYIEELKEIENEAGQILKRYSAFNYEMQPLKERLLYVEMKINETAENINIDLKPKPISEFVCTNNSALFDSTREYLEQMEYYRGHKAAGV